MLFSENCWYIPGNSCAFFSWHNLITDYGQPEKAFFRKSYTFGLGQTNWAKNLWGIWAISGQTMSTILALWVPYPWESVAGPLSYKKHWFLGLKHITPKYSLRLRCSAALCNKSHDFLAIFAPAHSKVDQTANKIMI